MTENFEEEFKKRQEQYHKSVDTQTVAETEEKVETKALVEQKEEKSINDISISDVKFALDKSKTYEEQAEDVAMAVATAQAVQDENTTEVLSGAKKSELISKATTRVKTAQKDVIEAETEIQKAERESYEGILETFGFFRHLPRWLTKIIVYALTPFFLLLGFIIGIPCGFIKILIDNIDGIICKYEKAGEKSKPRIKVTIWVLLALVIVGAVCLTVLACLHII